MLNFVSLEAYDALQREVARFRRIARTAVLAFYEAHEDRAHYWAGLCREIDRACEADSEAWRARKAARAWKRIAKEWRDEANCFAGETIRYRAELRDLENRLRTLIAAGGATAAELGELVEDA